MSKEFNLVEFVKQNAPYMTVNDMVEETGSNAKAINEIFSKLGLIPIKHKQKIKNFILEFYQKKPKSWIMKKTDLSSSSIDLYYKELNIKEPILIKTPIKTVEKIKQEVQKGEKLSVSRILSSFTIR